MSDFHRRPITRRAALGRIAVASGAALAVPRMVHAGQPSQGPAGKPSDSGEVRHVTTEEFHQSNIYCETPYCSRTSRRFVYARTNPKLGANRTELMAVELGTWKQERLDTALGIGGLAVSPEGLLYYLKRTGQGELDLMRADIDEGAPQRVYRRKDERWISSLGTVSPDGRYYAGGVVVGEGWKNFGIALVDLKEGRESVIDQDPFILNPHPQFDPGPDLRVMVQHNRGGKYAPDGKLEKLVGDEGATLYVLSVPEGKRTTLQVGKPHTTPCTGHEAWIGRTGEMLLTVSWSGDFAPDKGNLLGVRPGSPARVVARGFRFSHVGASRCGRLFSCDDWQPPYKIVIGSVRSGRTAVVCESRATPGRDQNTHPHPYLTPDLKWVIFNSNRSGFAHVCAAPVPGETVAELLKA